MPLRSALLRSAALAGLLLACAAVHAGDAPAKPMTPPPSGAAVLAITGVETEQSYVAAGQALRGRVRLDQPPQPPKETRLRVVAVRDIDTARTDRSAAGRRTEEVLVASLAPGTSEVPFEVPTGDMLFGTIQIQAELLPAGGGGPVSAAWSRPVRVGLRKRLDLAGEWNVTGIKVFEGDVPMRPKDWKPPAPPAKLTLPGRLPFDDGFRGWVTLATARRATDWKSQTGLQPRGICIDGASDSAAVRVNGKPVGQTCPVEDAAVLTHWVEFHCPFKGPENEQKRLLLITGGSEYPVWMPLGDSVAAEGTANIEITLRATSGGMLGQSKPPYGILGAIYLDLLPSVYIRGVSFDTEKPGPQRRFKFALAMRNDSGKPFQGTLRTVYGSYQGKMPYTGPCPAVAAAGQAVTLPPGESTVEVLRDEPPRFDTCRATFLLVAGDGQVLDAAAQDFHTVTVEIRNRRDLYLNNERFFFKAHGSWAEDANSRLQLRIKGGNGFRGHRSAASWRVPGFSSEAANLDERYRDGLLTSAGSALLASCEKCTFWNPKDPSNVDRAVRGILRRLAQCPGVVQWEATNELHGEPEEARVAILEAFHKYDPYHRPVLATKAAGEWEAEAREGRVAGVDIVGCQYLLSKEGVDSITAAITEQPIMSTEVNWNDMTLYNEKQMYKVWLEKGVCGSLLFDYSGSALDQPVPLVPPDDGDRNGPWYMMRESHRALYQDLAATAVRQADGRVLLTLGNRMPYTLRNVVLTVRDLGQFQRAELKPGDGLTILMPAEYSPPVRERAVIRAEYATHGGLKCFQILTPRVAAAPVQEGEKK